MRLALWCAGLVTVSGAVVVVLVLALTGNVLRDRAAPAGGPPPIGAPGPPGQALRREGSVVDDTIDQSRTIGLIVVGGLALASIGIGWLVAGRMLAPVNALATTAAEVTERSLHRRIALDGPDDELKALADALDAMLDRLDAAFAAQRRFVADASHELRTPLATIRAEVDALRLGDAGARIDATLDRAEALINALLTLSRSDAVALREPADLATLAGEVVTATPLAGFELRTDLAPAPVTGDPALLTRLAGNLIENAARYNRPGGLLAVTTAQRDGTSVLTVANDGEPVPAEEVPRLTERFRRRERTAGGFGLGLAIADAIARGHDGTLVLRSRPEGGLEVVASLPADASVRGGAPS